MAQNPSGDPMAPEIQEPYVCDELGLNPVELRQLDYETVSLHLAYREGRILAEWAAQHPHGRGGDHG